MTKPLYYTNISSFFAKILKPHKYWLILMFQAPVIGSFFTPVNNYALKLIVDEIAQNQNFTLHHIIFPVILFCGASIILEVAWRIANYADYKSQPKIEAEIVNQSYAMLLLHNYQFFQNNLSGKIASKITSIRDKYVQIFDNLMFGIVFRVLSILITLVILFFVNLKLAIIVFLWLIIFMPLMFYFKRKGYIFSQRSTAQRQKISGLINDSISNISSVLFFSATKFEKKLIQNSNENFIKCEQVRLKFLFINHFIMGFIYSALSIAVLFLLINLKTKNLISVGDFVMVIGLMFYMIETSWGLLNDIDNMIQDFGDLKESFIIFEQNNQIFDKENAYEITIKNPTINFKNIIYYYQKNNLVFDNFNLKINAGEKIGLIGHSGAGKSTLVNLLLKVFTPNFGEIIIDDKNISDITFESLRENIALIPQDPTLFHRTIFENIAYGKLNCSQEEVIDAGKKAAIHDFIISLPMGYETLVGERGIKLSGGQRQRIAIARAILKNAPILILDEATSSLDSETESEIQNSINLMLETNNATVIAIAHRLSTIKHMDRIIVIDNGKIIEDGSFEELMACENGRFREMWDHQANGMVV